MTRANQPIDRELLTGFRLGDERSLERLFRERYASLTTDATTELGDAGAAPAPRVVERAFVRAWEERSRFETPESLDQFLHSAVHDAAVRERSRLAALHRFESHEGGRAHGAHGANGRTIEPLPLDEAWKHVHAMLHAPPADPDAAKHRAEASRHEAAHHMAAVAKDRPIAVPLATAAVIGAAIVGGLWWVDRSSADVAVESALSAPDSRTISSRAAQRGATELRDGSKVSIGADTRVTISSTYGTKLRALKLDGAASFDVVPNATQAFVVRARDVTVTATGTSFDVAAYANAPAVVVRVRSGGVTVKRGGEATAVAAGRAVAVGADGAVRDVSGPALDEAVAWTDGKFVVTGRPLREVLPLITRWYGLEIKVPDQALLARPVTASASLESSREAIAAIERSAKLAFDYEGKTMILRDAGTAAPKAAGKKK